MKHALIIAAAVMSSTFLSCQNRQGSTRIAKEANVPGAAKDAELVRDLTASNYAEIEMARTAGEKTENKEVKDLAGMLEADHTRLVQQLKAYAADHNISLPEAASKEATEDVRELAEKNKPDEFDKKWCAALLDKQEQTISKMERAANDATDPDLKVWINNTLPMIRMHRDKLNDCNNSLR